MYRNYYLFARQVRFLNEKLSGKTVVDCFTHRKDELVLNFEDSFLRIGISPSLPYLLNYEPHNIKEAKFRVFDELHGMKVKNISILPYDKIVNIRLGQYLLQAVFFGRSSNVHLFDESGQWCAAFKKSEAIPIVSPPKTSPPPPEVLAGSLSAAGSIPEKIEVSRYLSELSIGLNRLLAQEICLRAGISTGKPLADLTNDERDKLQISLKETIERLNLGNSAFLYGDVSGGLHLSTMEILQWRHLPCEKFDLLNVAWIKYVNEFQQHFQLRKIKQRCLTALDKHEEYLRKTLSRIADKEQLLQRKAEAERNGNLLLTNLNTILPGSSKVTLTNIFSPQQEKVEISLNPAKSIQENARKYFERYKDVETKAGQLEIKKDSIRNLIIKHKKLRADFEKIKSLKQARQFEKRLIDRHLIQSAGSEISASADIQSAFNRVLLDKKWEVFIGRNAKNNDLLTFRFAKKHDLWLHAQGVPGSHVVVKLPVKDQLPPKEVIEQAAAIAAFNSNAKNSNLVPVNYTFVRFVRKPRKAPPGTVVISREKTVFVKPLKII